MVGKQKCEHCRAKKKKCVEDEHNRVWDEGGTFEKCPNCAHHNLPCGPPEGPAPREARPRLSRNSLGGQDGPEHGGDQMEQEMVESVGTSAGVKSDKEVLMERRLSLKELLESFWALQSGLEELKTLHKDGYGDTHLTDVSEVWNATRWSISMTLVDAESLATRVADAGDTDSALYAYIQVLEVYRVLGFKAWHEISGLLRKMAVIYFKIGHDLEAQGRLWEILHLGDMPRKVRHTDLDLLKVIARSVSKTSKKLAGTVHSNVIHPVPSNLHTPVPPLQGMMKSQYADGVVGSVFQTGPFPNSGEPIVGGMDAILDLLRQFHTDEHVMRDLLGRTPLHLAAELGKEGIGHGLMRLAREHNGSPADLTNSRDIFGQTILGCAILNNNTFDFIETLISHGAEVDPVSPPPNPGLPVDTPLQIAAKNGRLDVVTLLINGGADKDRGSPRPEDLARRHNHTDVVQLLNLYGFPDTTLDLEFEDFGRPFG